jgi:hypothetical protein
MIDFDMSDLGAVTVETKQRSPIPPYYADSVFGLGEKPNTKES